MAIFTVDLFTGKLYLFTEGVSGSTPTSGSTGSTYPLVNTYADLPSAIAYTGQIYAVRSGTGTYVVDRKDAGLYFSNGAIWYNMPSITPYFSSTNYQLYDGVDNTKGIQYITSGLTSGVFRKIKVQNGDGTIAYLTDVNTKLNTSIFNTYTGTTAPAAFASKSFVSTYTGTTVPNTYYSKTQINNYTGTTAPAAFASKSFVSTYTGTTVPSTFASKSFLSTYTGTTVPNTYYSKTQINNYTGTTVPNTYYSKTQINNYTGTTAPAAFASKSFVSTYTGTTVPNTYYSKTQINNYTGNTRIELDINENYHGNGVMTGFSISINVDTTKIDISSGVGYIVDNHSNFNSPVRTKVIFTGKTGIVLTYRTSSIITYLGIDKTGTIVQQATYFTADQRRQYILIGAAIHSNKSTVNAINNLPDVIIDSHSQFNDLLDSLKNFNKEGNVFSPNGANLSINKSIGKIFKKGVNFSVDAKNPHIKELAALIAPANIRYRLSDGTEYSDTNVISKYYESAPGVRTALPNGDFSIQRITIFSSNLVRIQYGQAKYNTMVLAKAAIFSESFITETNIGDNGLLRAYLIIAGRVTDLTDTTDALFIEADKFGTMPLGGTGAITTLQQAYGNSVIPQIVTSTALGTVTVRRGSAADTDSVVSIQNGTGETTTSFKGNGDIVMSKATGIGIKVDTANPTFGWRDLIGVINTRTGGATVPSYLVYIGGIYQWSFGTAGGVNEVFNEYHILHDYVPNSDLYVHTHWSTILAPTGDVNWMFEITQAKGYNQAAFSSPVTIPVVQTSTTAYNHMIAEVRMSAPGGLIASAVNVSITSGGNTLTSATSLFTNADIGRTIRIVGAGAGGSNLDTTISAFGSATSVTVGNNAGTTVTLQPNFNYRVIDSSLLEIDGLILVRTWRDSNRAADTLNVAPFLHFVDIHYQSTGLPTKDKNYPFYT